MAKRKKNDQEEEQQPAQQYVWMKLLLDRTETIDSPEKARIQEELKMYVPIIRGILND